jgi:predicted DNA-binding transcriptional regulator AlpA
MSAQAMPLQNPNFSVSDIAEQTGVDRARIYQAMYKGDLIPVQKPGRLRFTAEEVNRWLSTIQGQ